MNKLLLEKLMDWPKPIISGEDLRIILNKTDDSYNDSYHGIIKRAIKEKFIIRLCHDLFLIGKIFQKKLPDTFELAQLIYGPSYISFESALSAHQWIPEGVMVTTSACCKRSRTFETHLGLLTYERIPLPIYSFGLHSIQNDQSSYILADPWKAVADLIYVRKKYCPNLNAFAEDFRVEIESLKQSNDNVLKELSETYPNLRTRKILDKFYGDLKCL